MKMTRCDHGHFYDQEKYQQCPYCNSSTGTSDGTIGYSASAKPARPSVQGEDDVTVSGTVDMGGKPQFYGNMGGSVTPTSSFTGNPTGMPVTPWPGAAAGRQDERTEQKELSGEETQAFFVPGTQEDEAEKEESYKKNVNPVAGWLVCTGGPSYGKSFELHIGKNFIGRSTQMDISLVGDGQISRNGHAIIIYEPKKKQFFAQPGMSHSLFYVNDQVVLNSMELKARDIISLGATEMIFVPFCDDKYSWGF